MIPNLFRRKKKAAVTTAVHTTVPGRKRFYVPGLKSSAALKQALEALPREHDNIFLCRASTATGKVLIFHDTGLEEEALFTLIREVKRALPRTKPAPKPQPGGREKDPATKRKKFSLAGILPAFKAGGKAHTPPQWHTIPASEALKAFDTQTETGLSFHGVVDRRNIYGANVLPQTQSRSGLKIFMEQMNSLPVYLLGAAAGVSILTGGMVDAAIIFGVVVANGVIGYVTETRAEKNIDALNDLVHHMAEVVRDGKPMFTSADEVVPGDILLLKPGSFIPADSRIIEASRLTIDESMLTGESLPVAKHAVPIAGGDTALGDRKNMAFMGTCITGGQGRAVVVATGSHTEIGALKRLLNDTDTPETPIERQLDAIGNQLIWMCGAICTGVFGLGLLRGFGFLNMLRMSISLAAAAVPEGLPAMATINFAIGINRMKKDNIVVRHLPAVETLGAIQTLCLDKTGTLTQNCMRVTTVYAGDAWYDMSDQGLEQRSAVLEGLGETRPLELEDLIHVCALCCETKINGTCTDGRLDISGSATESALTAFVSDSGVDVKKIRKASPLVTINHRSEDRLFMSTVHKTPEEGEQLVMVKGSPLEVLSRCDTVIVNNEKKPLSGALRERITRANAAMAGDALRVLGLARRRINGDGAGSPEQKMTWLGLVGMMDPPRPGIGKLLGQLHTAGVRTVMITGDQEISARTIARQLNLSAGEPLAVMDSRELNCLDEAALMEKASGIHVFSRVSPSQKLKIVKAIKASGRTVAMTGDGINDSPALKAADIGIAMGRSGTDLARDVADVVLTQDNLELMASSLADGRTIFHNIRKSVHFSLATNISEIQLLITAMVLGLHPPLNVMQLLWINLISDIFPGLALCAEKPETDVMEQPPRDPEAPLFSRRDFRQMVVESSTMTGGAMAAFAFGLFRYGAGARAEVFVEKEGEKVNAKSIMGILMLAAP
ncbi:MAG: HAD-IC family P-type ATPase, partial [Desulfobacteraceae bacterium]